MGEMNFIRIANKLVNMDEVESIEYVQSKVPIDLSFNMEDEYRIEITYKSGRKNIISLEDEETGITLMKDICSSIREWNIRNEGK